MQKKELQIPKISVIVPVYNVAEYLERSLNSILNQSFTNFELLLIDDGSTDGSERLVDDFALKDKRIQIYHKNNGGLSDARNFGLNKAGGKYVTFIDSDDTVDVEYLKALYTVLKKYNVDIATCYYNIVKGSSNNSWKRPKDKVLIMNKKAALLSLLYDENISVAACSKLYKKSLFDKGIKFPFDKNYEDVGTTWKLLLAADSVAVIQRPFYNYIMRNDSISHQNNKMFDRFELAKSSYKELKNLGDIDITNAAKRYFVFHCLSVLRSTNINNAYYCSHLHELKTNIKKYGNHVLIDKRTPKRDKIALLSLKFGTKFYKFVWKIYVKLRRFNENNINLHIQKM